MRQNGGNDLILPPGTTLRDRYEIQKLLHTGGMGIVYLANDKILFDRTCVLKQVRERLLSEEHRKKLEEEAHRMSMLNHPNIAIILDHFVERDYYFLVVEYIHGKTLSEVSKGRPAQLTEAEVVQWAVSMCDVISYIHEEGIIHRDISPDNIMLTEEGRIKFIDFGTLRELRYIQEGKTAGMGKYGYTPPEQWQGKPIPQSDIFALGATLYQLLTGFLPLSRSYIVEQAPQKEDFYPRFPPIRNRNPGISPDFEQILQKALQLDPEKRFISAAEMCEALCQVRQKITTGNPVHDVKTTRVEVEINQKINLKVDKSAGQVSPESEIKRRTVLNTVQHPMTLVPAATCIVAAIYLVLLSPIFGGAVGAIAIMAVSGIASGGSYIYRYNKEYPQKARELFVYLEEERARMEKAQLSNFRDTLRVGFSSIYADEGVRALSQLALEYEELQQSLDHQKSTDPLSISQIPVLAAETYRQGLAVLNHTLELMEAMRTPDREKLQREIFELERDVNRLTGVTGQEERLSLKHETLASHKKRLAKLNDLQLHVDQLLFQAQRCESSLHSTRIEIATIRAGSTKTSVDAVIETLQERIIQMKEVQEELKKLGY